MPPDDTAPAISGLDWAHPLVRAWFVDRFGTPTEPQARGWPSIRAGRSTLISAPTGSGKTLTAFLACLDALVRRALDGQLTDRTTVVYVSPLKALGNDIHRNLEGPLAEILALAHARGLVMQAIRTAVRTGDTLAPQRRAMLARPPHILVTTPESLYLLLTSARGRATLSNVATVIVDEIHAVADDKRGAHLTLTLERLEHLTGRQLVRIGLSATQRPIETIARFLVGHGRPLPAIVHVPAHRTLDLAVVVPDDELGPVASQSLWDETYDRLAALIASHRSTLVFVNTRRLSERVSMHLAERLGADAVAAHHGSLSRRTRLEAERRLKAGSLRVLVATASLELGIDVGTIDLVCQIGSPRSLAAAIQRIGRSGHWRGAVPKGRLLATTRDELLECAAVVMGLRAGDMDTLHVPPAPLDVLAQQIVAMCAAEDWDEAALFDLVRRAAPYGRLSSTHFTEVVTMLADGLTARRGRFGAYLHRDAVHGRLRGRRGARLAAITNGGAIPDTGLYTVVAEPEGTVVGTVDEDFAVESMAGDVMLLGNASWRIRRVTSTGRMIVEDAHGASPSIPFWRGEAPGRTDELSILVSQVREGIDGRTSGLAPAPDGSVPDAPEAVRWLAECCGLDRSGAEQLVTYVVTGRAVLGAVPSQRTLVVERFFDEGGGMQIVLHSPFGARLNRAWGLALRKRFCRSFNFELQATATDDGITIALAEQHSFPLADVFAYLTPATARTVLEQAALASPLFATRWRWDAARSLALPRFRGGRKLPLQVQRILSDDLLAAVFPDVAACQENIDGDIVIPDHPLVREVMTDVLTEAMDADGLDQLLGRITAGTIRTVAVDTPVPSVFAHALLHANPYAFLDDAPLEERRARAVSLRRVLPGAVLDEVGSLDPEAIAEVRDQAWPDVRDEDDVHDALLTLVALPVPRPESLTAPLGRRAAAALEAWRGWLDALTATGRAGRAVVDGRHCWVAAERQHLFAAAFPDARFETPPAGLPAPGAAFQAPLTDVVRGWLAHAGPTSSGELARLLGTPRDDLETALLRLEASGLVMRGRFTPGTEGTEWCDRRLLARIHRLTLGRLRREIAPVSAATFMRWLFAWQHVAPGTQWHGDAGLLAVLRQLQAFEAPANAWEAQILPARVADYAPEQLDRLCLSGQCGWGRFSPHPAFGDDRAPGARRIVPTSVAPLAFFLRADRDWMAARRRAHASSDVLSPNARDVHETLARGGAQFFADLAHATRHLPAEIEAALWELASAGLVTADGFDNLRALLDPRRRTGRGSGRRARPAASPGRWACLPSPPADRAAGVEASVRVLLERYGVLMRELVTRETNAPPWRELLGSLRRMEHRGEVRGGRFVSGTIGEQFALPDAVESLRAHRHRPPDGHVIRISAADPLNLAGILVPGDRVPAQSGRSIAWQDGVPLPSCPSTDRRAG